MAHERNTTQAQTRGTRHYRFNFQSSQVATELQNVFK